MNVPSLYWSEIDTPAEPALSRLMKITLPLDERRAALLELMASEHVVARGLAMDFVTMTAGSERHGEVPIINEHVLASARTAALRELELPPFDDGSGGWRGANHSSALAVLGRNSQPGDAGVIARVLSSADPSVLEEGVGVAEPILAGQPAHPELVNVLTQISRRRDVDPRTRADAISAIGAAADEDVTPILTASLADPELAVSAAAARRLLERDLERHRALVAPVAAAWPAGGKLPYDVNEVRDMLGTTQAG